DCTLAHPCATFKRAHDQTSPGGEVGVLTPGSYAATSSSIGLSISKSINVTNDGVGEASIVAPADGDGIFVGGGKGDVVSLRGLVLDGLSAAQNGLLFQSGAALHVQSCVIRSFRFGVLYLAGVGSNRLFVSDSLIYNNGTVAGTGGIFVRSLGASHG